MTFYEWLGTLLFWSSLICVVHSYALYPIFIWVASILWPTTPNAPSIPEEELPSVSFLIAAYNEEKVIAERIQNAVTIVYPRDRYEVVVASDGSTDSTDAIVASAAKNCPNVRLISLNPRSGKSQVLNRTIPSMTGDVVVLSDANTWTDPGSVRSLVRWFRLPDVGTVCGNLSLVDRDSGRNADGVYWQFERFLKSCEGRVGALLGANGGIYAIRKRLFQPIPPDTLVDDFVIPLTIQLETGSRIIYDSEARATEETPVDMRAEFARRARIGNGGFQAISRLHRLLNPRLGWVSFAFWSHKVLRWFGPFFLFGMLAGTVLLLRHPFYRAMLVLQAIFYLIAVIGPKLPFRGSVWRLSRLPGLFLSVNLGFAVGFLRWLRQRDQGIWDRTAR